LKQKNLHTKINSQDGLTLIEVLIAMFLIVVLFVLYLAAYNTVALVRKDSYEDTAYHIANKEMESLREVSFYSLAGSGSISDPELSNLPSGSASYSVTDFSAMTGVKEIAVTVNWNDGNSKQIVLKTLAGNGGLNP
jgi:prepilin-type N-terminal cleavage/methylation domain-containing protein